MHWIEKLFVNYISEKALISRMYKELLQLYNKNRQSNKPLAQKMFRHFTQKDTQMAISTWKDAQHD